MAWHHSIGAVTSLQSLIRRVARGPDAPELSPPSWSHAVSCSAPAGRLFCLRVSEMPLPACTTKQRMTVHRLLTHGTYGGDGPALLGLHVLQTVGLHASSFMPQSEGPGEADAHCVDEETEVSTAVGAGVGWGDKSFLTEGEMEQGASEGPVTRLSLGSAPTRQVRTGPGGGSAQPPGATKNTAGLQMAVTARAPCETALRQRARS